MQLSSLRQCIPAMIGSGLAVFVLWGGACAPGAAPRPTGAPAKPAAEKPAQPPAATAPDREELARHFRGKTIALTVGYAPGGGFDTTARIFAEFAPRHIPGHPTFAVVNLPGGDSLVAAQKVMAQKPDGLNWVLFIDGLVKRDVLGDLEGFDATKATYLGTPDNTASETFFMVRSEVATSVKELLASPRPLKIADARGGSGAQAEFARLVGFPFEIVYGYGGTSEYFAALNRGEVDGSFRGDPTLIKRLFPEWAKTKFITPIMFFDAPCCQDFIAEGGWEMPPALTEVVKLNETQKRAYDAHTAIRATRLFALPPSVPDNIRLGLQQAFADTLQDPEFVKVMHERAGITVSLGTGEEILRSVRNLAEQPKEVQDILRVMYQIK